jgi:2-C-methyl-D-erythritol 4-phosphate cytidylyltransferase/2-C-methyl-D-erythritol 2,4-cyclodiphosphate synthase
MYQGRQVAVLIMAAGSGSRFGSESPKQFLDVDGEPMLLRAARAFDEHDAVDGVWAVASPEKGASVGEVLGTLRKYRGFTEGGPTRQESVRLGLRAVSDELTGRTAGAGDAGSCDAGVGDAGGTIVLIHDAARPFVTREVIERVLAGAADTGAAIACVPVTDTIYEAKEVRGDDSVFLRDTPDRELLWSVQTPQGFDLDMIRSAHESAAADGFEATDDGAVAMKYGRARTDDGVSVLIAMGDYVNRKITVPSDMDTVPSSGADDRVGIGFDVHAFSDEEGRALVLGGVTIPHERGLEGHSDADVLTHGIMDAMLGALALGDIGVFFPDTDSRYEGVSSMRLLDEVRGMIERVGYIVYNVDATIVAERPRLAGRIDEIRSSLADALGIDRGMVGVKATTTEGLGFTGREEGVGAQAVVRLVRKERDR